MPSVPRRQTFSVGYFVLAALALFWLQTLLSPQARQIPYSEFRDMLGKGWVEQVVLSDTLIRGTVKPEHAGGSEELRHRSRHRRSARARAAEGGRALRGAVRESRPERDRLLGAARGRLRRHLGARHAAHGAGRRRHGVHQEPRPHLRREGDRHHVRTTSRGRTRPRRSWRRSSMFLKEPGQFKAARRQAAEGRPADRPAGHRQDAAGEGRGRRGQRAVLLDQRLRVRRAVRRHGRGARARPLRTGREQGALHRLHRRARRAGQGARAVGHGRRPRRAREHAEPAAGRDGRLRHRQGRGHPRSDQPAGGARPGAPPRRPLRPAGADRPARPPGTRGHPAGARQGREAGVERRLRRAGPAHAGIRRRRPGQHGERGRVAGDAPSQEPRST